MDSRFRIVPITAYDRSMDDAVGGFQFTSDSGYRVRWNDSASGTIFTLEPMVYERTFEKREHPDDSEILWYDDIVHQQCSFGALEDDDLIAVIIVEKQSWNNTLFIRSIQVHKDFRRMGIGAALVDAVGNLGRQLGFRALALETQSTNGSAIDFYRRQGFRLVGLNTQYYSNDDLQKGDVALFMHKRL